MAGPCLTIYLREQISKIQMDKVLKYLEIISDHIENDDFYISGFAFAYEVDCPLEDYELNYNLGGWSPKSNFVLISMSNSQASHIILAMMACKISKITNGKILLEFITKLSNNPSVLTMDGHIKLNEFDYAVNSSYLSYWMSDSGNFRLSK